MSNNSAATKVKQAETLVVAQRWGYPWTNADIELLEACGDVPAAELAEALQRSLYAVHSAREALARGERLGGGKRRPGGQWTRTWTFIGNDVPDGW
jgi:hypothetical protein